MVEHAGRVPDNKLDESIEDLKAEVDALKKHVALSEPSGYPRKLFRVNVRVPPVLFYIFFFVALAFGMMGIMNARLVRKEAMRVEALRKSLDEDLAHIEDMRDELREANKKVLDEVWTSVPEILKRVEDDISVRISRMKAEVEGTIEELNERSDEELAEFGRRLQNELNQLDVDIKEMETILKTVSGAFIEVGETHDTFLTPREHLILTLIAREMDPTNPQLNYAAAEASLQLGNREASADYLANVFRLHADKKLLKKAKALDESIQSGPDQQVSLHHESPGRTRVGPYGIFELTYYTLTTLVNQGLLTVDEAQAILDRSKGSIRMEPNE
jgi:hypothetical protein